MYLFDLYCKLEFWILRKIWLKKFGNIWEKSIIKYWFYGDAWNINIWKYVYIWENCHFWGLGWIHIWDGSIIAANVIIRSSNHDYKTGDYIPYGPKQEKRPVIIWENCWVWANVLVAPWTQIWEWSIVGFGAVVSWKYPPYSVIVWNPGKVIKQRDSKVYDILKNEEKIYLKHFTD